MRKWWWVPLPSRCICDWAAAELVLPASMGVEQVARLVGLIEGVLR